MLSEFQMVMLLMQHGADPNIKDGEGCSGLHLAAQFGHTAIVAYLVAKRFDNFFDEFFDYLFDDFFPILVAISMTQMEME